MLNHLEIDISNGLRACVPGQSINIQARWTLSENPESIEMRLIWYTRGKGDQDISVVERKVIDPPAVQGATEWEITLPMGPYSFSGKLISLIWAAELLVFPGDQSQRCDFEMGPGAREVLLSK